MGWPYITAFEAYHLEPPADPWTAMLDFHLQAGFVVSTPRAFIAARLVSSHWADSTILTLAPCQFPGPLDTWHVWVAAGEIADFLGLAASHGPPDVRWASFQRRGFRLHRIPIHRLHGKRLLTHTAAHTAAAGSQHRR